jgi:Domain of unknown function (DUF4145)
MQCGVCGECIVAQFNDPRFQAWIKGQQASINLLNIFPRVPVPNYPQDLPANVERFYRQATDAFARRNWDSAGTMFRKALDSGLKILHPQGNGNLHNRIDNLPEETGVTPAMKEWAHRIRRLGNDAAHEDDPFTEIEAKDLLSFTELFLTYAYTLPARLVAGAVNVAPVAP